MTRKEHPGVRKPTTVRTRLGGLIDAAEGEPGTWFAEDVETVTGAPGTIYAHFGRKLVEVKTSGKTVYLRVKDDS